MKKTLAIIFILIGISYIAIGISYIKNKNEVLGATILTTATTDTIGTFRTNVNTSLTNLNNAISDVSTTWIASSTHLYASSTFNKVGIGNIFPSSTLHITGDLRVTSTSTLSAGLSITGPLSIPVNGTINTSGQITVRNTSSSLNYYAGGREVAIASTSIASFQIASNTDQPAFQVASSMYFKKAVCTVPNISGNSIRFNIGIVPDRSISSTLTDLFALSQDCSNTTSGITYSSSSILTIPAGYWVTYKPNTASTTAFSTVQLFLGVMP